MDDAGFAGGKRLPVLLAVFIASLWVAAVPASAQTVKHSGSVVETRADSAGGCEKVTYFTWSELPGAVSYHLVLDDTLGFDVDATVPPYDDNNPAFDFVGPATGTQHRLALTYQGGGVGGCQANDVARYTIVSFTASFCGDERQACETQVVGSVEEPDGRRSRESRSRSAAPAPRRRARPASTSRR